MGQAKVKHVSLVFCSTSLLVWEGAGGPRQYLHLVFPHRAERVSDLSHVLQNMLGEPPDCDYKDVYPLPVCLSGFLTMSYFPYCFSAN